jgi:3-deoxy-D-arabino-heptulosonate 7-phosphate (DAHP) synthase
MNKHIMIAGPCAAESKELIIQSAKEAKKHNIDFLRVSLFKPRTKPGYEGVGEDGIDYMIEAAKLGVNPGTEILFPDQAKRIMDTVLEAVPDTKILLWIGARNQHHVIQRETAKIVARDPRAYLLVKNQPWKNKKHWEGILEHCLEGGIDPKHLIACHRGFAPHGYDNPHGMRNVADFEMAMEIRKETGIQMVFDPSHIGGTVENVQRVAQESAQYDFDGLMVEVHPDPRNAMTDPDQQVTWEEFDTMRKGWEDGK